MKSKVFNFLLLLSSLLGFLEWGGGNQIFLFQAEAEILRKLFTAPMSVLHPFTVLPLIGQVLLLITLFQKQPSKRLTFISIGALSLLLGFMFLIGLISLNIKVLISTLPFLIVAFFAVRYYRSQG